MTRMATATIRSGIHAMTIVSAAFHSNLASNLICAFAAGRAAIGSTQVVMHEFSQAERQVRHAAHRRDYFQDWQLRDRR